MTENERAQRQSQLALLAAEAALFLALRSAIMRLASVDAGAGVGSEMIRRIVSEVLHRGRRQARRRSFEALQRELVSLDIAAVALQTQDAGPDLARVSLIARRIVRRLLLNLEKAKATEPAASKVVQAKSAAKSTVPHIRMVARTEAAHAFNAERIEAIRKAAPHLVGEKLFKEWNADLDKRTCDVCEGMHGTVVEADADFSTSLPAHPNCRCTVMLVRGAEQLEYEAA